MKAGQLARPSHAVGHACLSWMPLNGRREEQQTVLLWATQPSLGLVTESLGTSVFMSVISAFKYH